MEVLASVIKQDTATGNWFIAIALKTEDTIDECGAKWTLEEKLRSAVSLNCEDNIPALNSVDMGECACLSCGTEIPCNMSDLTFEQKLERTLAYTNEGEWAFRTGTIAGGRGQ